MKIPFSAYRPSFKLNLSTFAFTVILLSLISGCGGSSSDSASPTVSLTISTASSEVYAGGVAVSLSANKSQGSGTVNWSLSNTSLGSLSATSGDNIQYIPPSPQSVNGAGSVTITASVGSVTQSLTLPIRTAARLELVAGTLGGPGNIDDVGTKARFYHPQCIVVDKDGTVFVCDTGNGLIRKITPAGVVSSFATIEAPRGLTIDRDGKIYVIDGKNNLIRSISPQGEVSSLSSQIGLGKSELKDIAVDAVGNLYVLGNSQIHRITQSGIVSVFAGNSSGSAAGKNGKGENATFYFLQSIVIDKENNLYVLDANSVRKITPDADVTTVDEWEKLGAVGQSYYDAGIAIDPTGNLFLTRIQSSLENAGLRLRRLKKSGGADLLEIQGAPLAMGLVGTKIAIGANGKMYLADAGKDRIVSMTVEGNSARIAEFAGRGSSPSGSFYSPQLTVSKGELLSFELSSSIVSNGLFGRISQSGNVTKLPTMDFYTSPYSNVVADTLGNLYFASSEGIVRFSPLSSTTSLIKVGFVNQLGIDQLDRLYFATFNAVYRLNSNSDVELIAGDVGNGAPGRFGHINGLHVDRGGNIYVTAKNVLMKINASGNVTTIAGREGESGAIDGTGSTARFNTPSYITSDVQGNIYLVDSELDLPRLYEIYRNVGKNHTIRKISPTGVVSTIAGGVGRFGVALDSFPNTLGSIYSIQFVAPNTLYVSSEYSILKMSLTN